MIQDYSLSLVTPPVAEPVTLEEARRHLRVSIEDDDPLIETLVTASREQGEAFTRRTWMTATYAMRIAQLEWGITIPVPPLQSVSSIVYTNLDGTTSTLSNTLYTVDSYDEPGRIIPAYDATWPTSRSYTNDVVITFVAGYANAAAVPKRAKQGMLLLIGHLYENREAVNIGNIVNELPMGVKALWGSLCWGNYA